MSVVAFILAITGAGLNIVWPIVAIASEIAKESKISVSEALAALWKGLTEFINSGAFDLYISYMPSEIKITCIIFLVIPVIAVISGVYILIRKNESFFAKILALCACPHLYYTYKIYTGAYSSAAFRIQSSLMQSFMPYDMRSIISYVMFMFLSWGLCYALAAAFAYFDSIHIRHVEEIKNSWGDIDTLRKLLDVIDHESESLEEKKYYKAVEADAEAQKSRDIESMIRTAEMFEELGDYKDSKLRADSIRQQIKTKQEAHTSILKIIMSAVIVGLFVIGIIILDRILHM